MTYQRDPPGTCCGAEDRPSSPQSHFPRASVVRRARIRTCGIHRWTREAAERYLFEAHRWASRPKCWPVRCQALKPRIRNDA